ncbi:MAG: hypothetical protein J0I41_13900 [Filimonas sp.]|nr:hypothetical protein [Filimonas sp.]
MWSNPRVAVSLTSLYLLIYIVLLQFDGALGIAMLMFFLSPFFIVWMVLAILKNGHFAGKELQDGEEYGYSDRLKK